MNPWSWLAGFALGWCLSAGLGLGVVLLGWSYPWQTFVLVIAAVTPAWPVLEYAPGVVGRGVRAAVTGWRELFPPRPRPAPRVTFRQWLPTESGYLERDVTRSARWAAWQAASEELFAWYLRNPSLLVEDTVGRARRGYPFGDPNDRKALLDVWDALGLAENRNGVASRLLVTPEQLAQRLASGNVEWPEDRDPPAVRPCPEPDEGVLQNRPTAERYA